MPYYGLDWTYSLVLIGAVIAAIASSKVKTTYAKFGKVGNHSGMTAMQAARTILDNAGLRQVRIERIAGNLTDHYSPKELVLRLSDTTINSNNIAAIGVAAHECGHAIQHKESYGPLKFRNTIVPAANLGSKLGLPIILLGVVFGGGGSFLVNLGIWVFSLAVLFQLVTLPVEFNASNRALVMLEDYGILGQDEKRKAKSVLSAASSIIQLLRLIILFGGRRNDRD